MTLWTVVLDSFHSSLIDEMNAKFPNEKPTLGLPRRSKDFSFPESKDPQGVQGVYVPIYSEPKNGGIILAVETGFFELFGCKSIEDFYKILLLRVGSEFTKRNIKPRIGQIVLLSGDLPKGVQLPERIVWIPFEVSQSKIWLAIAV